MVKGKSVTFSNNLLLVELQDGRVIGTPLTWYKELQNATLSELSNYRFICDNTGIEWENLDCHLSISAMLKTEPKTIAS